MLDFCVVGAGVVGGMIARELRRYSASVAIVEREGDVAMGATRANSAIVHAGFDAKVGSLKARLNVRGSEMMESVCAELGVKYKRNGSLVVGFSEEDRKTLEELCSRGEQNGVRGLRVIDREQILSFEKNIGEGVTSALHAPTGAIVCPYELCMASVGSAMDNGAELLLDFEVVKLEKISNGYRVYAKDGRTVDARYVINCAGVYSDKISEMAGFATYTVHARRGEYMLLDRECGELISHTVFRCPSKMGKGILVTPTVDGNLLLGPTAVDIHDKEDTKTTAEGLASVRAQANEQVMGIPFGKIITSFTGLRSVGSTGDFIIGFEDDRFLNVGAIESPGLSSSPAIAQYVVELLQEKGELQVKNDAFVGKRAPMHAFHEMSVDEKNEVIARDPAYAHIICRCELVTEGEIRHAIRQNPKPRDVDGVKRRTRASMGRCQGGFCTPYVIELLAEELGVDYKDVTKFGKGSFINVARTKGE